MQKEVEGEKSKISLRLCSAIIDGNMKGPKETWLGNQFCFRNVDFEVTGVHLSKDDQQAYRNGKQYQERSGQKIEFSVSMTSQRRAKNSGV